MRPDLWVLVVLGALGVVFFLLRFNDSFPSASIDLRMPKRDIAARAVEWANKLGYKTDGAISSTVFNFDDSAKNFLEYELGQAKANQLMRDTVPVWYWRTRFCRPFEQEECTVALSTDGRLAFFDHSIPNDQKLSSLSHAEARKLAEDFVQKNLGISLQGDVLIDDGQTKQLNRTDHYFTWKQPEPDFNDGKLYTYTKVAGNQLVEYNRYLHVPDKFTREFARIRSQNNSLKGVSYILYVMLAASIAFIFIWAFANGRIRWKLAGFFGLLAAIFTVLGWIDTWPTLMASYNTAASVEQYITQSLIRLLIDVGFVMVQTVFFVAALEPIYRMMFPEKVAIERVMGPLGLRSISVFRALVAGMAVFGIHLAYVVAFYLIAQRLGMWSPLEVRDADTLSNLTPVIDAVNVGFFAGTSEEMMYRVLCLAAFQRFTKNFWVANVLQAASWAFMHSDYPQEPPYARGIELTIAGTFYGWVLRKYGIVACVLSHYTYDALLGVTSLMVAPSWASRLTAIVAILPGIITLAISAVLMRRKGVLQDEKPIENRNVPMSIKPPPVKEIEPKEELLYRPLSRAMRTLLIAITAAGILVFVSAKRHLIGYPNTVTINRARAVTIAEAHLTQQGINLQGMRRIAWLSEQSDATELQYVLDKEGFERTQKLARGLEPSLNWRVRFFKELQPTEYYVLLSGTGKVQGQYVVEDEDTPGAKLTPAQAEKAVTDFLRQYHSNLFPLQLDKEPSPHDYKNRRDFDMSFTAPEFKAGDAEFKVISGTVGDRVSGFSTGWRIPDEWKFERQRRHIENQKISDVLRTLVFAIASGLVTWVLVDVLRAHKIRWKPAIVVAAIAGGASLIDNVNGFSLLWTDYRTEEALETFLTGRISEITIAVIWSVAIGGLLMAFAYGAFRRAFLAPSLAALIRPILPTGLGGAGSNRHLWLDAVLTACAATAAIAAISRGIEMLASMTSPAVHLVRLSGVASLTDQSSIWVDTLISAVTSSMYMPIFVAGTAALSVRICRKKFVYIMLATVIFAAVMAAGEFYWIEGVWQVVETVLTVAVAYFFIVHVAKLNVLSYVLTGYVRTIMPALVVLVRYAPEVWYGDIAVLVAALAAPFAYTAWLWLFVTKEREV